MDCRWLVLLLWILLLQAIGATLGWMTTANIEFWYAGLAKSVLTPPSIVFGIVWPLLYLMMAVLGFVLWSNRNFANVRTLLWIYLVQLFLNWLWTPLFFHFHLIGLSVLCMILLIGLNMALLFLMDEGLKKWRWLQWPYVLWLVFALYLNAIIWWLN